MNHHQFKQQIGTMIKPLIVFILAVAMTACGGGSSSNTTQLPSDQPSTVNKASDFTGTWAGFAQTNTAASVPFTFDVSGANDTMATVAFASVEASGTGPATVNQAGKLSFTVATAGLSPVTYTGVFSKAGSTLTLESFSGGAITTGTGSCTPQALGSNMDLSGVWTGTSAFGTVGSATPPVIGGDIKMILASNGFGGYVGSMVDSTGTFSGPITVNNGAAWGSPTIWLYRLITNNGTSDLINLSGGFDTTVTSFGDDGKVIGGLDMILGGYTAQTGHAATAQLYLSIQRQ